MKQNQRNLTEMKHTESNQTGTELAGLDPTGIKRTETEQTEKNISPMSNEGRNAYVVQHLTESLLELLRYKPMEDISISELCSAAGVGRASFYRNYESKEDILKAYISRIFHRDLASGPQEAEMPVNETIYRIFSHYEKYHEFYSLLNERSLICLMKDVLIGQFGPLSENSALEAYAKAFVAYSIYGWTEVWFQRGMRESAKEMADLFQIPPASRL